MRIELGAGGKIVGTRKVSPNGQVSGLKELAGREVLVILPGDPETLFEGPGDYLKELQDAVQEQVRQSLEGYLTIEKALLTPFNSTKSVPSAKAKDLPHKNEDE